MLVFGDGRRREAAGAALDRINAALASAASASGLARHAALVTALIEAGMLAQGLADHGFAVRGGQDGLDPGADRAMALATALARRVLSSWDTDFEDAGEPAPVTAALAALDRSGLPDGLDLRVPEGFAHYAVYPEGFGEAARTLPAGRPLQPVGLRSIGTTLAALVAAARPDALPPLTLRPVGHPFDRGAATGPDLDERLRAGDALRVIVDEGPGLSGSSVAGIGAHLLALGVPEERLRVVTSHDGPPGSAGADSVRAFWARIDRRAMPFDRLVLGATRPARRLEGWFADLRPTGPVREITGGGWRAERGLPEAPAHPWAERRKFLLPTETGPVLLRFGGLGTSGLDAFAMARALHEAEFGPEPLAFRHGFRAERWYPEARPLHALADRPALLATLGRYLGFRARRFPCPDGEGASVGELLAMARHNTRAIAGSAARLARWEGAVAALERCRRPIRTDGRLHAWEWLVLPDRILKADGTDHHASHDLVGVQDPAWDLAGAAVEFALAPHEIEGLRRGVEEGAGRTLDDGLIALMRLCYPAFWHGHSVLAAGACPDEAERRRFGREADRYAGAFSLELY